MHPSEEEIGAGQAVYTKRVLRVLMPHPAALAIRAIHAAIVCPNPVGNYWTKGRSLGAVAAFVDRTSAAIGMFGTGWTVITT